MISEEDLTLDQGPGLITQGHLCNRVLLKRKKEQRKLLTETSEGGHQESTPLTSLIKALYTFTRPTPTTCILN